MRRGSKKKIGSKRRFFLLKVNVVVFLPKLATRNLLHTKVLILVNKIVRGNSQVQEFDLLQLRAFSILLMRKVTNRK